MNVAAIVPSRRVSARAPRGQRAYGSVPRNWGKNTTLVAGLSLAGIQAPFILEGAMDTVAFELYVEQVLAPSLKPGQVVVLANVSVHKGERVRQASEARGCQVLSSFRLLARFDTHRGGVL
jgi:DDE superfamily endonuclease